MSPGLVVGVVGGSLGPRPWSLPLRLFCVQSGWPVLLGVCCLCPSPFAPALCFLFCLRLVGVSCSPVFWPVMGSLTSRASRRFYLGAVSVDGFVQTFFSVAVHVSRDFPVGYLRDLFSCDFNLICFSDRHVSMLKLLCNDVLEFGS